jgi:CTP synthase
MRATCSGWTGANSTENDRATPHPVIAPDHRVADRGGERAERDARASTSAAPCAWAQECRVQPGTLAHELYGKDVVASATAIATSSTTATAPAQQAQAW